MALKIKIKDDINGVETNHHRIRMIVADVDKEQLQLLVRSYTSKAMRDKEKEDYGSDPSLIDMAVQRFYCEQVYTVGVKDGATLADCYKELMKIEPFIGARVE